jgi:hypothetical protein
VAAVDAPAVCQAIDQQQAPATYVLRPIGRVGWRLEAGAISGDLDPLSLR